MAKLVLFPLQELNTSFTAAWSSQIKVWRAQLTDVEEELQRDNLLSPHSHFDHVAVVDSKTWQRTQVLPSATAAWSKSKCGDTWRRSETKQHLE